MSNQLSAEDLIGSGSATHTVKVPAALLKPEENAEGGARGFAGEVTLRPLLVRDVERVARAAQEQRVLGSLPAGVVQFLSDRVNRLSGLTIDEDDLERAIKAPLARACFILAREFGWTPAQCSELTVGQVLLYLEMLGREEREGEAE